ncbi:hypothetical protein IAQ61_003757 [Plenodomus lingam]|uniref:uncharacterized protein n=1 Tax=Leptosphaeria maculans TaxID=5022 RepID=UPI0033166793|nr:hypothetical protein IAQ61_003757 [Plenodomus lingam]
MNPFVTLLAVFTGLSSTTSAAALSAKEVAACPCYTATSLQPGLFCPPFTKPCAMLQCLALSTTTTTIPAPVASCSETSTLIEMLECQTACSTGCGTVTVTATATTSAVCTATITPAPIGAR